MIKNEDANSIEMRAQLFRALGHPTRLLILNLIRIKPRHGEELAEILNLKPATISFHLAKLSEVGLLSSRKEQYYNTYSLKSNTFNRTISSAALLPRSILPDRVNEEAYREKVIKTFMKQGRIILFPAKLKKRLILLEEVVQAFKAGKEYREMEVNRILLEFNDDVATLRRYLVDYSFMKRKQGIYWKVTSS
ncbi:metalloregulator ArsR/SmtB family transcription factor [bacterium]|nr:metalloregulator ArsR/SmtB family transcription factor [bacterium]